MFFQTSFLLYLASYHGKMNRYVLIPLLGRMVLICLAHTNLSSSMHFETILCFMNSSLWRQQRRIPASLLRVFGVAAGPMMDVDANDGRGRRRRRE